MTKCIEPMLDFFYCDFCISCFDKVERYLKCLCKYDITEEEKKNKNCLEKIIMYLKYLCKNDKKEEK